MTDYVEVRKEARKKGVFSEGSSTPIPIQPTSEYSVTRMMVVPVRDKDNKKILGLYMRHPAILTVVAWSAAEASSRADDLQANFKKQAWGQGHTPWDGEGKINWHEVPIPQFAKPYNLR